MTTEAQTIANRKNTLKSTGPKSEAGKDVSCQNAIKHGLLSKNLLVNDESCEDLKDFQCKMCSTLNPQGVVEVLLNASFG